ncbi:MAG: heparinase II/III family protein [Armatimonadota bacterium]|nr:heparinase II/III family protein [Armatimonadota bacterium]
MKTFVCTLLFTLLIGASGNAGPLFDDYLNPVRPGPCTGPGNTSVSTGPGKTIGQTFTVDANVGEIYRIGVRPVYDSWDLSESVTLCLYSGPDKKTKLREYTISGATSRVQQYVIGDGSHFRESGDRVLFFQLRVPTGGRRNFYFELTSSGGDGKVAFQAFVNDAFPGGSAVPNTSVADLSFECHIKLVADREANLRKFFTERLDLSRPELAAVKSAVEKGDWEQAIAETVKHFHNRMDLWESWRSVMTVQPDPNADTSTADLILKGMVLHADTGKPIPWRKESWWAPEIPDAKMPSHGIKPSPDLWDFDRVLAAAYTATGKPEYARAAIDIRIQWILDNPNPKLIYNSPEFPYYHELWNDRTAAARMPGHGDLVYARLYNFSGWTNDEKLILLSFFEDNARWVYQCKSGGNWLATAAKSALDFGIAFPEWKISGPCKTWGATALIQVSKEGVRGEGTCVEGSIKYHAMVARRLLGLLKYHVEGTIELEQDTYNDLVRTLNGMYDHMAHTLQPNNYVVMCGDSWYENYTENPNFSKTDLRDPAGLLTRLRDASDPVSTRIKSMFSPQTRELVEQFTPGRGVPESVLDALVAEFNKLLKCDTLFDQAAWKNVHLRRRTIRALKTPRTTPEDTAFINRWLIEDAYPNEIAKAYTTGELYEAGKLLTRPDIVWIASQGEEGTPPNWPSKVYPEAGYFIMRSDFGEKGSDYRDARHVFIHNGGWFGSHGHWDLTCLNLYAYGRTLVIDPGQYDYKPPEGIDVYWTSNIHSIMVCEGRDVKREPGANRWVSNSTFDWFDGRHNGYNYLGNVNCVRRRVAFVKPDYILVDDSAETTRNTAWTQVWNLTDPNARFDPRTGVIATTFDEGGNLLILNQNFTDLEVRKAPGITAASKYPKTSIFRLTRKTANPRFQTLLFPYLGNKPPKIVWQRIPPDNRSLSDLFYSLRISTPRGTDWAVFGSPREPASYRSGSHISDAAFAVVRLDTKGRITSFGWADGSKLIFNGKLLAEAAQQRISSLSVAYVGSTLYVECAEPHPSIRILTGGAKRFVVNGKFLVKPVVIKGFVHPFPNAPAACVADDLDGFVKVTKTNEWTVVPDPAAWSGSYTQHETDPGRHECGEYVLQVPKAGVYAVEVFLPVTTITPSDRVEYTINAEPVELSATSGPIVQRRMSQSGCTFVLNQQTMAEWVRLGTFSLSKGELRVQARNVTERDGLYFIADAVRIVPVLN